MLSHGNRRGVQAQLLYEPGEEGALTGIAGRDGDQVLWIERIEDRISAVSEITGRRVEYSYTNGLLTRVADVLGHDTHYEYDSKGRLTKKIDPAGNETLITYDKYNNVASVKNGLGEGKEFEFDFNESRNETYLRVKTTRGMIREIWYNRDGETIRVEVNGRTVKKFTKEGRNLLIEDEYGRITRKDYVEFDNLVRVIHPDGSVESYQYDLRFNRRSRETNALGVITEYAYDDDGNLITKTEAAGTDAERITEYTCDQDGNQLSVRVLGDADTLESLTRMTYDDGATSAE